MSTLRAPQWTISECVNLGPIEAVKTHSTESGNVVLHSGLRTMEGHTSSALDAILLR